LYLLGSPVENLANPAFITGNNDSLEFQGIFWSSLEFPGISLDFSGISLDFPGLPRNTLEFSGVP
jgi:hypothetical protein